MIRVAFAGLACSGKTTASDMAIQIYTKRYPAARIKTIKFADPHYEALHSLRQAKNRTFLQGFSDLSKKCFGDLVFTKLFENFDM